MSRTAAAFDAAAGDYEDDDDDDDDPIISLLEASDSETPPFGKRSTSSSGKENNKRVAKEESEDDSDVEIVEEKGWLSRLKRDDLFPVAEEILSGRKFKCPGVVPLRKFLLDIITRPAREYFDESSEYRTAFGEIVKMCNAGWDNDCQRAKAWIKSYVAEMLSVLLVLRQLADGEKKAASGSGRTTKLSKAFDKLQEMFDECHLAYTEEKRRKSSKAIRMPSLDLQLTGPRLQDTIPWDEAKKDSSACPVCLQCCTMPLESDAKVNAEQAEARAKATASIAAGGDGKCKMRSAKHGCFGFSHDCEGHDDGYGCSSCEKMAVGGIVTPVDKGPGVCKFECPICDSDCAAVFMEHNRQKIATAIMKQKEKEKSRGDGESDPSPEVEGRNIFMEFALDRIDNHTLRERQNANGRTSGEIANDATTLAALDMSSNRMLAANSNVGRGLAQVVPRSNTVIYRAEGGTTVPMSLSNALRAARGGSNSFVPDGTSFISNKGTNNRAHRNGLTIASGASIAATAAMGGAVRAVGGGVGGANGATATPSMMVRVTKKLRKAAFTTPETPTGETKRLAHKAFTGLSNKDNAYTAIVEHAEEEEDSQDISAMCISHAGREGN